jgi:Ca2+-transporting ATPase
MLNVPRIQTGGQAVSIFSIAKKWAGCRLQAKAKTYQPRDDGDGISISRPRATSESSFLSAQTLTPGGASIASSITFQDLDNALTPDPGTEADFEVEDNKFAFTPGHLNKMQNPKSLPAFAALGWMQGLEKGLRTNLNSGLSIDEGILDGSISFQEVTKSQYLKGENSPTLGQSRSGGEPGSFVDRIETYKRNIIPTKQATPLWKLMWMAYNDKVLLLLTGAAIISLALGVSTNLQKSMINSNFTSSMRHSAPIVLANQLRSTGLKVLQFVSQSSSWWLLVV